MWGNKKSLLPQSKLKKETDEAEQIDALVDELRKYHDSEYSADRMKLVVYVEASTD